MTAERVVRIDRQTLPPYDLAAEEAVIAACLLDDSAVLRVVGEGLQPSDFFDEFMGRLFGCCIAISERSEPVTTVTLVHEAVAFIDRMGGEVALVEIVGRHFTGIGAEAHARIVMRDSQYRRLISSAGQIAQLAYAGGADIDAVMDEAQRLLRGASVSTNSDVLPVAHFIENELPEEDRRLHTAGYSALDHLIRGVAEGELLCIGARTDHGKALSLDTPLPTPYGWTTMGAVQVGDQVFDEHGNPARVIFATGVMGGHPCYEVVFSDGECIVADAEHLWWTLQRADRSKDFAIGKIVTTAELAATLRYSNHTGWNHRIPVAGPLDTPDSDLAIEPYVLGVWLGDGSSRSPVITKALRDEQILNEIRATGLSVTEQASRDRSPTWRLGTTGEQSLLLVLRSLDVIGNKHIPPAYLRASISQRMGLLQGLMDTDGSVSRDGQCEFTTMTEALARDVHELLLSLGVKATVSEGVARLEGRDIGPKWRIGFYMYSDQPPFRLERKKERLRPPPEHTPRSASRRVVAVKPVASVPVRCIQVDSPSSLYLAGHGMIPTHNTALSTGMAFRQARAGVSVGYIPVEGSVGNIMHRMAATMARMSVGYAAHFGWREGEEQAYYAHYAALHDLPLYFPDQHRMPRTIPAICGWITRAVRQYGIKVAYIDHLDAMVLDRDRGQSPASAYADALKRLQELAGRESIALVFASQVNREASRPQFNRDGSSRTREIVPPMAYMRESGAKEEASQTVLMIGLQEDVNNTLYPEKGQWMHVHVSKIKDYAGNRKVGAPGAPDAPVLYLDERSGAIREVGEGLL